MTYSKPEVNALGEATRLIQGSKTNPQDGDHPNGTPEFELED
jgi:hypothetical protein